MTMTIIIIIIGIAATHHPHHHLHRPSTTLSLSADGGTTAHGRPCVPSDRWRRLARGTMYQHGMGVVVEEERVDVGSTARGQQKNTQHTTHTTKDTQGKTNKKTNKKK
jgi:hypothetical protein